MLSLDNDTTREHRGAYRPVNRLYDPEWTKIEREYNDLCVNEFAALLDKEYDFYGVASGSYAFKLDDNVYEALIDENDGYQSSISNVQTVSATDVISRNMRFYRTPIARVKLVDCTNGDEDFYKLIDVETDHVWLVFGTDNADDYYPSETFRYQVNERCIKIHLVLADIPTD